MKLHASYTQYRMLIFLLLVCAVHHGCGHTYYVKPSNSKAACPGKPCYTLNYYIQNEPQLFNESVNTTLEFLPGIHILDGDQPVPIELVKNFTMIGSESLNKATETWEIPVEIRCQGLIGFNIAFSTNVFVHNLVLTKCGASYHENVNFAAALMIYQVFNLSISRTVIQNTTGYGIFGTNILGTSIITQSVFKFNRGNQNFFGGNMWLNYQECTQPKCKSAVAIQSSVFAHGYDPHRSYQSTGTGLAVFIEWNCSNIAITIDNITASDNEAYDGGNMALMYRSRDITNSIHLSNSRIENGYARYKGGGIHIWTTNTDSGTPSTQQCDPSGTLKVHKVFNLTNVTFVNNIAQVHGGAVDLTHAKGQIVCYIRVVTFQNCHFIRSQSSSNIDPYHGQGHALFIEIYKSRLSFLISVVSPQFETILINCSFTESAPISNRGLEPAYSGSALQLDNAVRTIISNCTFKDNIGSAIQAISSNLKFEGLNIFTNNTGINGGALSLDAGTSILLQDDSIHFNNNKAQYGGGAIYISQSNPTDCFVFFNGNSSNVDLVFHNNTATFAGTDIFADVDSCNSTFDEIFHVKNTNFNRSLVSFNPKAVCFCNDSTLDCDTRVKTIELYPGETIVVPATTVGSQNGTVPGGIHANFSGTNLRIEPYQVTQGVTTYWKCADLRFTAYSSAKSAILKLRPETSLQVHTYSRMPVELHLNFKNCPPGFILRTGNRSFCGCSDALKQVGVTCNISSNTLFRPTGVWIGYINDSVEGTGVIVHPHCPFDYCKKSGNNMSLSDTDEQCNYNRSGMFCGRCKSGLSLALGSSKCIKCSDMFLTLLIAFAFAGVLLVCLLFICNLTVSEGTVNGLIFYANILWVNKTIFFPSGTSANILTVFLAWLNLDLGMSSCLYKGLDAYIKTWLQFAFPIYIWALVGLIVILSRRFMMITRLMGTNAVKVLATLFLLSYTKLQRTIIAALSFTYITFPDGAKRFVWLYDGNIDYGKGKHTPLLVVAVVFLVLIIFPYVLMLLFVQCLKAVAGPRNRLSLWLTKLNPILDAYAGPYKFEYPYWTGVLLLVRTALFLVFAFNYVDEPSLNLMAIMIASLFVLMLAWSLGGIYKRRSLDVLESSFILNLGITAAATLYVKFQQKIQAAVVCTSTGIAFSMFLGILAYHFGCRIHIWEKVAKLKCLSECVSRCPVNWKEEEEDEDDDDDDDDNDEIIAYMDGKRNE